MAVVNTSGRFNVGRDISIVLIGPSGNRVDLVNVMSFDCKQETADIKVDRLDGVQLSAMLPKGWTGTIEVERGSPAVDQLISGIEAAWYNGAPFNASQIFTTIVEADGSTSTFAFDSCSIKCSDMGNWKGDASVKQKLEFLANRRRQV